MPFLPDGTLKSMEKYNEVVLIFETKVDKFKNVSTSKLNLFLFKLYPINIYFTETTGRYNLQHDYHRINWSTK